MHLLTCLASEVLASKRDEVSSAKRRYDDGLEKVISTEEQVRWKLLERENMTRSRDIQRICSKESAKKLTNYQTEKGPKRSKKQRGFPWPRPARDFPECVVTGWAR